MADEKGWKAALVGEIPPSQSDFMEGWHSIRWFFGITGFGINAVTKKEGEVPVPEHDESDIDQQELFFVYDGVVEFSLNDEKLTANAGTFVCVEPQVKRSAKVVSDTATIIIVGGKKGTHSIAPWDN